MQAMAKRYKTARERIVTAWNKARLRLKDQIDNAKTNAESAVARPRRYTTNIIV